MVDPPLLMDNLFLGLVRCFLASSLFQGPEQVDSIQVIPLSNFVAVWQLLPSVSQRVLNILVKGYTIQFASRSPHFNGVLETAVNQDQSRFLNQTNASSLGERLHRSCKSSCERGRFLSWYFIVPKKDWGLHPVLDPHDLNCTLRTYRFKMLTFKLKLSQIQPKDWFVTIDLMDTYFQMRFGQNTIHFKTQ